MNNSNMLCIAVLICAHVLVKSEAIIDGMLAGPRRALVGFVAYKATTSLLMKHPVHNRDMSDAEHIDEGSSKKRPQDNLAQIIAYGAGIVGAVYITKPLVLWDKMGRSYFWGTERDPQVDDWYKGYYRAIPATLAALGAVRLIRQETPPLIYAVGIVGGLPLITGPR